MKKTRLAIHIKNLSAFLLFVCSCSFFISANAALPPFRLFGSIGGGANINTNIGTSQSFPIQNPTVDEFYDYNGHQQTQTTTFYDLIAGFEWSVKPDVFLQTGIDYDQTTSMFANGHFTQGADVASENTYKYSFKVITRQLLAEGKLLGTLRDNYHPYFMLGLGTSINTSYSYDTDVPTRLTFTRIYKSNTIKSFSYAVGLGLDLNLSNDFRIGFGYRFSNVGEIKLGTATIDGTDVSGTLSQPHIYNNQILAQMTYEY